MHTLPSKDTILATVTSLIGQTQISIFIAMWKDAISTFKACKTTYEAVCYVDNCLLVKNNMWMQMKSQF